MRTNHLLVGLYAFSFWWLLRQNTLVYNVSELDEIESVRAEPSAGDHLVQPPRSVLLSVFTDVIPSAEAQVPLINTAEHLKLSLEKPNELMCVTVGFRWRYPSVSFGARRPSFDALYEQAIVDARCPTAASWQPI